MSSALVVIAGVAIVAYTIGSQILGAAIRAKRLIVLPGILTVIGVVNLTGASSHPRPIDIVLIVVGAAVGISTGLALGRAMHLEERNGGLWGQLPKRGLWLWLVFFASRGALVAAAYAIGAHVAAGTHAELLVLGLNRLGQAAVVAMRAIASGIPFTPESDGSRPLGGLFSGSADSFSSDSRGPEPRLDATEPDQRPDPIRAGRRARRAGRRRR